MKNKIVLTVFIIILLAIIVLLGYHIYNKYFCYTEVSSIDNSFKLTIPNRVKFKIKNSDKENYFLDLYSVKDEMFLYTSVINKKSEVDLNEAVDSEKNNLVTALTNVNSISDTSELTINDNKSCKYSYIYSDSEYGKELYSEVVWIETESKIYILDLEVITKNMNKYKPIFEEIENSFIEI